VEPPLLLVVPALEPPLAVSPVLAVPPLALALPPLPPEVLVPAVAPSVALPEPPVVEAPPLPLHAAAIPARKNNVEDRGFIAITLPQAAQAREVRGSSSDHRMIRRSPPLGEGVIEAIAVLAFQYFVERGPGPWEADPQRLSAWGRALVPRVAVLARRGRDGRLHDAAGSPPVTPHLARM
jgi:hypothetical protein